MIESVMLPLDGSSFGESALSAAVDVARRSDARLDLVTVNDSLPARVEELSTEVSRKEASGRYLEEVRQRIAEAWDGETRSRVMRGPVVDALDRAALDAKVDLVVMATHGRGPFSRFWLGSVADGFVRRATVPVLLLRPAEDESQDLLPENGFETILVPLDRAGTGAEMVRDAVEIGALFDARYHLVTVLHHPSEYLDPYFPDSVGIDSGWLEQAAEDARQRLTALAERMEKRGLKTEISVVDAGSPAQGILEVAEEAGVDLVAVGTHGRRGVPRLVLGSVADKIVRASRWPVLLYRPPSI